MAYIADDNGNPVCGDCAVNACVVVAGWECAAADCMCECRRCAACEDIHGEDCIERPPAAGHPQRPQPTPELWKNPEDDGQVMQHLDRPPADQLAAIARNIERERYGDVRGLVAERYAGGRRG